MQITCPYCQAEAQIPESKEGAKVRCGECEKVYHARRKGSRGRGHDSNVGARIGIFVGAGLVFCVIFVLVRRSSSSQPEPAPAQVSKREVQAPVVHTPVSPWDAEPVLAVRELYDAIAAFDDDALRARLDLPSLHAARAAEGEPAFVALTEAEVASFGEAVLDELTDLDRPDGVAAWVAFDGAVKSRTDDSALVEVRVSGRSEETALESRTMEWSLVHDATAPGDKNPWLVSGWRRVISAAELEAEEAKVRAVVQAVRLTDGSRVYESEPAPVEHLDSTPAELRTRIDALYVQLIDLELSPRDNADAKQALVEIGGPALPVLLTGLFEIELTTQDEAIQVNLIDQCLRSITGHRTGYKPQVGENSVTGTTGERRDSAIKQWFAWWHRDGEAFLAAPPPETEEARPR